MNAGGKPLFPKPMAGAPKVCPDCNGRRTVNAVVHPDNRQERNASTWRTTVPCRCQEATPEGRAAAALAQQLPVVRWCPPSAVFEGKRQQYIPTELRLPGGQPVQVVWEIETWTLWVLTPAPDLASAYAPFLLFHAVCIVLGRDYAVLGVTSDAAKGSWVAHELQEAVRNAALAGVAHQDIRDVVWDVLVGG